MMRKHHHDPELESVAIATAGMGLALAAHNRKRHYALGSGLLLPLAKMELSGIDLAQLDFMLLTFHSLRPALMAGCGGSGSRRCA